MQQQEGQYRQPLQRQAGQYILLMQRLTRQHMEFLLQQGSQDKQLP
jgi:hypothetical protein